MNYSNIIEKISVEGLICVKFKGKSIHHNLQNGNFIFIRNNCEYEVDDIVVAEFEKSKYDLCMIKAKNKSHGYYVENMEGKNLGWTTKIHGKVSNIMRNKEL